MDILNINIFVYGTLMFDPVWLSISGRSCFKREASLTGYKRTAVKGQLYPVLIPASGKQKVDGIIYFNISKKIVNRLDVFEGHTYFRQKVNVSLPGGSLIPAHVYILKKEYYYIIDNKDWDAQSFESEYLPLFLKSVL